MLSKDVDGEFTSYTWDYEDRLVSVELPDGRTVSFEYCDGCSLAKRLKKTILAADGTTILSETTYRWDGENIIGEEDEFGNVVDYFVMPFSLMDNVVSMKREGQDYYYLTDVMGSVYQVVDADGNVVNSYDYNSWGEIRESQTTETVANPFRWQTKPWDEDLGLYYSRARYYDAGVGRFVSVDPQQSEGSWGCAVSAGRTPVRPLQRKQSHLAYAFGGLNPCGKVDPTGEADLSPDEIRARVKCCWQERADVEKACLRTMSDVTDVGAAAAGAGCLVICVGGGGWSCVIVSVVCGGVILSGKKWIDRFVEDYYCPLKAEEAYSACLDEINKEIAQ